MKKLALILFLSVFSITILAQDKLAVAQKAIDKKDYKTAFNIAKELLESGDANNASRFFIQLRAVNYPDTKLYEYLGDAYAKMGVNELAVTNYEEAEKYDSLNIALKFKTAEILEKQKKYTDAVNKYLKIQSIDPQNAKAYLEAGNIYFRAKQYADAAKMYEKYLEVDKSKQAYENISKAFYEARNWEKTYEYGTKALELYGANPSISKYVANSALQLKKYDEAAKYFTNVPDSMLTVNELEKVGRAFQAVKDYKTAKEYFEKVIKLDSTHSSVYYDLGNYYFREKKFDEAIKYYEAKAKSDSTFEPAYRFMGFAFYQMGRNEEARVNLLKSISKNPKELNTNYFLAKIYIALDSLDRAADVYKEVIDIIGNNEKENKEFSRKIIPASTWAVFTSIGPMPTAIHKVWDRIFQEWFPSTGYEHAGTAELEVYLPGNVDAEDYRCEVWIPIIKK